MNVCSGLEQLLLRTHEGVGPHAKATLRYIQELKKKHGIDYDSAAPAIFLSRTDPQRISDE